MRERITDGLKGFFFNWVCGIVFWPTFWGIVAVGCLYRAAEKNESRGHLD